VHDRSARCWWGELLQRDDTSEYGVLGEPHGTHAAGAEQRAEAVARRDDPVGCGNGVRLSGHDGIGVTASDR
jgi:hypothetical protein